MKFNPYRVVKIDKKYYVETYYCYLSCHFPWKRYYLAAGGPLVIRENIKYAKSFETKKEALEFIKDKF